MGEALLTTGLLAGTIQELYTLGTGGEGDLGCEQTERQRQIGSIVNDDAPLDAWKWAGGSILKRQGSVTMYSNGDRDAAACRWRLPLPLPLGLFIALHMILWCSSLFICKSVCLAGSFNAWPRILTFNTLITFKITRSYLNIDFSWWRFWVHLNQKFAKKLQ